MATGCWLRSGDAFSWYILLSVRVAFGFRDYGLVLGLEFSFGFRSGDGVLASLRRCFLMVYSGKSSI